MVHEEKNIKTKKLPRLGINIKSVLLLAGLGVVFGLIYAFGASFSVIVAIYLGYRVLRLVMRLFGLVLSIVFTVISILIFIAIISLLII